MARLGVGTHPIPIPLQSHSNLTRTYSTKLPTVPQNMGSWAQFRFWPYSSFLWISEGSVRLGWQLAYTVTQNRGSWAQFFFWPYSSFLRISEGWFELGPVASIPRAQGSICFFWKYHRLCVYIVDAWKRFQPWPEKYYAMVRNACV